MDSPECWPFLKVKKISFVSNIQNFVSFQPLCEFTELFPNDLGVFFARSYKGHQMLLNYLTTTWPELD